MEFVEGTLALLPVRRMAAKEALDSEWLRLEDEETAGPETEEGSAGRALLEGDAPSRTAGVSGQLPPGISKGTRNTLLVIGRGLERWGYVLGDKQF
jgi:hypothetical protein